MITRLDTFAHVLLPAFLAAASGCGREPRSLEDLGRVLAEETEEHAALSPEWVEIAPDIFEPVSAKRADPKLSDESCRSIESALERTCIRAIEGGVAGDCTAGAHFYWAHDFPRCSARLELFPSSEWSQTPIVAFDFVGTSVAPAPPECGNGVLEPGEECDDANDRHWDGCDPNCAIAEFQGCEAVIESLYERASIARIDRKAWTSPRSHLMVHTGGRRLDPKTSCVAAGTTAASVCAELETTMPFVSSCAAEARRARASDESCSVRIRVGFSKKAPEVGVFNRDLPGILAFTIR